MATQVFAWALHELQILPENLCKCLVVCASVLSVLLVLFQLNSSTQPYLMWIQAGHWRPQSQSTVYGAEQS